MKYDPQQHHRRSIRVKGYDYAQAGAYFVTIVTQGREPFFGKIVNGEMVCNDAGQMVVAIWESLPVRFPNIELGVYVVMPNHFHAILIIDVSVAVGAGFVEAGFVGAGFVGAGLVPALDDVDATNWAGINPAPTDGVDGGKNGMGMNPAPTLGQIIGAFKSITTHEYIEGVDNKGWARFDKRLWQRNYYEHIIRNADEANRIHLYIEANPAQWEDDDENPARANV
jgi:putative transposase